MNSTTDEAPKRKKYAAMTTRGASPPILNIDTMFINESPEPESVTVTHRTLTRRTTLLKRKIRTPLRIEVPESPSPPITRTEHIETPLHYWIEAIFNSDEDTELEEEPAEIRRFQF